LKLNILLIPTTDWLGHPIPSRLHQIFEKIAEKNVVHVLRFGLYPKNVRESKGVIHHIDEVNHNNLAIYYFINSSKHFKAIRKIVYENQVDVAIISNLLVGYIGAKAIGNHADIFFDLSDHFPSVGAGYYFNSNSFCGKFATSALEKILKKTLCHAQHIVTCSHALESYVKTLGFTNTSIIPNGVDKSFLNRNYQRDLIREELALDGNVTIGYLGSVEFWLDIFPLLKAIKTLSRKQNVKLLLVGAGLRSKTARQLHQYINTLGITEHVVWLDFIPYTKVPDYIGAMDICTIPFDLNNPAAYYSAPNKLFEYLALGKTVIATPIPEIVHTARKYVNFALTSENYVRIIDDYSKNSKKYEEQALQGKKLAMQMTWNKIAQQYHQLLLNRSAS